MGSAESFTKQSKSNRYPGNGISFWGFLLSIFIYISVFYFFNLSPLALFNTTKFWFFISNTLIIIIAADFGAFSSSRKSDYYEECVKSTPMSSPPSSSSFEMKYPKMVGAKAMEQKGTRDPKPQEIIKDVVVDQSSESKEKKLEIIIKDDLKNPTDNSEKKNRITQKVDNDKTLEENEKSERKFGRSNSDSEIMVEQDEKKIQRSQSVRYEQEKYKTKVEENDFSTMSDEELNRRVEEFIQNFNRQIRLQAARDRQNLHACEGSLDK